MSVRSSFLKTLLVIGTLAALWLGAPRISRHFAAAQPPAPGAQAADDPRRPLPRIDPASLPPGTAWTFKDGAATHTYAVALNELYLPARPAA